jgi:signal transduction histidine kinase
LGSVFVLVCAWLFYATLRERLRVDEELSNTRDQLLQAQKLEAIGRLAGSVAHDFNNVLTVINGYAELAANALVASDPLRKCLEEIRKAGDRAESLTRQLLAFSRNQVSQKQPLHLSDVVLGLEDFVGQLIRNDVQIVIEPLVPGRIWWRVAVPGFHDDADEAHR